MERVVSLFLFTIFVIFVLLIIAFIVSAHEKHSNKIVEDYERDQKERLGL